jgi:hypothetical protein
MKASALHCCVSLSSSTEFRDRSLFSSGSRFYPTSLLLTAVIWKRHQRKITGRTHAQYVHTQHVWLKRIKLKVSMATASSMWKPYNGVWVQGRPGLSLFPFHSKHFTSPISCSPPFPPIQYNRVDFHLRKLHRPPHPTPPHPTPNLSNSCSCAALISLETVA